VATQTPTLAVGSYVQYNSAFDNPEGPVPSTTEQTIGLIRQTFSQGDGQYYQVVWNPGDARPKIGLYHQDQLTALNQQQANQILQQLAAGTYQPTQQTQGSQYTPASLPTSAIPPALQGLGTFAPTTETDNSPPSVTETS
jgi:hypothetical protein